MKRGLDMHFRAFAHSLEAILTGHEGPDGEDFTSRQKEQVENLVALEREFRQALIVDWRGPDAYKAFLKFIVETKRNILAARPYFRERQDVFKSKISPILRARKDKALYTFDINYPFIAFVMKAKKFGSGSRVAKLAKKVEAARRELIEMNLPLAISRARIFKQRTPQSHLDYMDLIQISNEGLIAAVDKFVLPYTPVFRAVIIGRVTGNLIEEYSDTPIHFYPSDKRKIYRANKARRTISTTSSWSGVTDIVNKDADPQHMTTPAEIQQLILAASQVSMDAPIENQDGLNERSVDRYEADPATRPDLMVEGAELKDALRSSMRTLTVFERKLLQMKGIAI